MAKPEEAVEFLRQVNDAESENRQRALEDLRFRYGDQWPQYAVASRGLDRPQLTINEVDSYIRQVTNSQRQQRPRGKAQPVDNYADPKIAKVITGLGRHIEVNSDADHAYDTAFDFAATMGWGYWRLRTDYIAEDSFNQDIYIDVIDNPFTVYFDFNSKLPDGSDASKALITDLVPKEEFKKMFPGAETNGFNERGTGDSDADWATQHEIRVAEYYYLDRKREKLVMLSDGTPVWESELERLQWLLAKAGVGIQGERDSYRTRVKWQKQTAMEVLEEKDLPGKWIPVVPVYWTNVQIESQRMKQGLVRPSKDPQRMVNFWNTAITESLAMAPKAKWLMAEGQDEGHENEWNRANMDPRPVLRYKATDVNGKDMPPPQRIAPEPPPPGLVEATMMANQNLQRVMGMFDPAVRSQEPKSGKAILAERQQSENSNFHGYDNLTRSIKHTWRIILSWIPSVYDTQRVQRIIGEDGRDSLVTLNEKQAQEDGAINSVLNDVTVGTYDVVMDTGPGYDTKRLQGQDAMLQLMGTAIGEQVAQVGADLLVRQMDFNESDVLADRLAAANPMAQIDEKSDIPPKAQIMIKGLQKQLHDAGGVIQQLQTDLKLHMSVQQIKEQGATQRELMKQTAKAHDTEEYNKSLQHSVEVKALTSQNVAEINGIVQLLVKHIDTKQLEQELAARNAEQVAKSEESASAQPA